MDVGGRVAGRQAGWEGGRQAGRQGGRQAGRWVGGWQAGGREGRGGGLFPYGPVPGRQELVKKNVPWEPVAGPSLTS